MGHVSPFSFFFNFLLKYFVLFFTKIVLFARFFIVYLSKRLVLCTGLSTSILGLSIIFVLANIVCFGFSP